MKRFKNWLFNKFLPNWAKESFVEENARLNKKIEEANTEIKRLNAYISGIEYGLNAIKK